ncbi:hypothetical protein [Streptomyces sp. NRRL S-350]|uniref:hypothetical protein n=1 Tax=Streptomyces sp. NRRL S-350 TaxID=1463902 RepID=UPI00055CFB21|nr:hypothetical protein [Streptomyces sp. NRRL S-350]
MCTRLNAPHWPPAPHPPPLSLVGPYVYSYDVSASPGRSATAPRSIPGMRPSYDAEHPHSTTPIYDELYSEYRRLFRALPGDRSGEEDLAFTGFAVRDGYPRLGEQRPYLPQHQAFHTLAGQAPGLPQFLAPQPHSAGSSPSHHGGHTGHMHHTGNSSHTSNMSQAGHTGNRPHGPNAFQPGNNNPGTHPQPTAPTSDGSGYAPAPVPHQAHSQHASAPAQFTNGQGWVAAGYLGQVPHPMAVPAPVPPAPPAPSPVMGTATGLATAPSAGGRHRQMLSLPPGRNGDHH